MSSIASEPEPEPEREPTPIIEEKNLNPRETDFMNAKAYLLSQNSVTSTNLYDHLVACLKKILDEKPEKLNGEFKDLSYEVKRAKFPGNTDTIQNKYELSKGAQLAENQKRLFKPDTVKEDDEEEETLLPNLMQKAFFLEQTGIGINREEMFRVWLAMKYLLKEPNLTSLRFWGKILGRDKNYYIVEAELRPEVNLDVPPAKTDEDDEEKGNIDDEETDEEVLEDVPPKPDYKPPPLAPLEPHGSGVNKKTYYVCNVPGEPWIKLPHVTPQHISDARNVKKFLTGDLEASVNCYPPFHGIEANFLRAQIARISAGTQVSPQGFYGFDEEEEEEEEEGAIRENFIENPEFEGIPVRELADPSMQNWVHHVLHILPQGRCKWWNPVQKRDELEEDEEEEEDREEPDEPEPEQGPPLLTPLSEDNEVFNMPAWTANVSSNLMGQYSVASVSSNLWPGAHAFAFGKQFDNIYIGFGYKYSAENMSPVPPPPVMIEFPSGPEITEIEDPTPEDEAAFKAAQAENPPGEGEEEVEEEEEEEEDD